LIHRDVKPGNILIERQTGRAKITDFGLAREPGPSALTREGVTAGTPTYTSPEQARGEASLDRCTDIYGTGTTPYESMTGRPPFTGPALAVLRRILSGTADGVARLWSLRRFQPTVTTPTHPGAIWGVVFAPDGKSMATTAGDQYLLVWELAPHEP